MPFTTTLTGSLSWSHPDAAYQSDALAWTGSITDVEDASDPTLVSRAGGDALPSAAAGQPSDNNMPPKGATIRSVSVMNRTRYTAGGAMGGRTYIVTGGTRKDGNNVGGNTSFTDDTSVFSTDGQNNAWTRANVFASRYGCAANGGIVGDQNIEWTRLQISVEYDLPPGGGGRIFTAAGLGPFVALGLGEVAALAATVYRRTRTIIPANEYLQLWRELRDHRYPRVFHLTVA
jgi:hypothetical protein